jgi:hypothetical protein
VDYQYTGAALTANIMAHPELQQNRIPFPFLGAPSHPSESPGGQPCWGSVIGWAQVACIAPN